MLDNLEKLKQLGFRGNKLLIAYDVKTRSLYELDTKIKSRHATRKCDNFYVNPSEGEMIPNGGYF